MRGPSVGSIKIASSNLLHSTGNKSPTLGDCCQGAYNPNKTAGNSFKKLNRSLLGPASKWVLSSSAYFRNGVPYQPQTQHPSP